MLFISSQIHPNFSHGFGTELIKKKKNPVHYEFCTNLGHNSWTNKKVNNNMNFVRNSSQFLKQI